MTRALTRYIASIVPPHSSLPARFLSLVDVDKEVGRLNTSISITSPYSFLISVPSNDFNETIGAKFTSNSSGAMILVSNSEAILNTNFSTAIIFDPSFINSIKYLNLFLIERPADPRFVNDSQNQKLVSPIIIASPQLNDMKSKTLTLYFTNEDLQLANAPTDEFRCVYYDIATLSWRDDKCKNPTYNDTWKRYKCICDHLSSFGLIWLPQRESDSFEAIDYASLVFQCFSIVCFLVVIVHVILSRVIDPIMTLQSVHLLPLISHLVTSLLLIFYIALSLTVYTRTRSMKTDTCFTSATVLMFFVYFLIIFMFGVKTSFGYFNYILFVRLFPAPSIKTLVHLLILAFVIAIIPVAIAIGVNSRLSPAILAVHANQICWFTRNVIHYFMTIPTGIFLLINISLFVLVAKRMIEHARNATSRHDSYQRMKKCVILLIVSSVSQGLGWITGPFLLIRDPGVGRGFEWVFVICNGLEGLWTILLYIVIRQQRYDEAKRVTAVRDRRKRKKSMIDREKIEDQFNSQFSGFGFFQSKHSPYVKRLSSLNSKYQE